MRPPESFIGQPIRSLQTMLKVIAENDPEYVTVIPDGIYGPETMQAVITFQRKHALPITGVTDQKTWDTIVAAYEPVLMEIDTAAPIEVIWNPKEVLGTGDQHPNLYLAQSILSVLSAIYHSIGQPTLSGVLDEITADAISSFQMLNGLPVTGQLDRRTWKHLTLQYPLASSLSCKTE